MQKVYVQPSQYNEQLMGEDAKWIYTHVNVISEKLKRCIYSVQLTENVFYLYCTYGM